MSGVLLRFFAVIFYLVFGVAYADECDERYGDGPDRNLVRAFAWPVFVLVSLARRAARLS